MLEQEKIQQRFGFLPLAEMMKAYDRDFVTVPSKRDIPQNPPPNGPPQDLFVAAEQKKKRTKKR